MDIRLIFFLFLFLVSCRQSAPVDNTEVFTETKAQLSPDERYGELFKAVQLGGVFPDSKTFVDCTPKYPTDEILQKYEKAKATPGFDLARFVSENFEMPKQYSTDFETNRSRSITEHINALWPVLTRQADSSGTGTLIPLPKPFIVPGGRFGEIYYWDSYFTILGLQSAGQWEMIENMADNFSYLIETVGFIPNGNRRYYQGRSQPPFYSLIIEVLSEGKGDNVLKKYLPYMEKEYQFWMAGADNLSEANPAYRRVVRLKDGALLNRYWDNFAAPRPEAYKEDVATAKESNRPAQEVYRDLRAGAESGWDYSSRWFRDGKTLTTIRTTEIIPVDLNSLLYHLEKMLEKAQRVAGNESQARQYQEKAASRQKALLQYCWNEKDGFFYDYDFVTGEPTKIPSLAAMYPLFFEMATPAQAKKVAQYIRKNFLKPGGVVTTLNDTGQQWDAPNGWAPLQWITIKGLRNYNENGLANTIKERWIALNKKVYQNTGKMVEKYNVMDMSLEAGGGEYPVQDGFGWSNGVLLRLMSE